MSLAALHSRLSRLRVRRQAVRWGLAWSALATGLLITLAVAFAVDWSLQMSRPQRFVSLAICAGVVAWVFRRHSLPWLGVRETDVDLALVVERNQHIDSDLVAALQFERPEARSWGSPQLERAVIDYVDDFSSHLNVFEGFSYRRLKRRLSTATVAVVTALLATAIFPGHVGAFLNRLVLGSAHYPTDTRIEQFAVNGMVTIGSSGDDRAADGPLKLPHGEPVKFEARVRQLRGNHAREGRVALKGAGASVDVALVKEAESKDRAIFRGELPRLVDSVSYQVYLGDAFTDPLEIHAIPAPVVTVELTPHPPAYAAGRDGAADAPAGTRQIAVIEGSNVDVTVVCGNKLLRSATLKVPELGERQPAQLVAADGTRQVWRLDPKDSPFADIRQPLRYEIQVVDEDGLSLERPLLGYIRLKADRPPRVAAAIVSHRVVPSAQPRIVYGALDDYGVSRIAARVQVSRRLGDMEEQVREVFSAGRKTPQTTVRGEYAFDLSPLKLEKGDELKITLEAFDYRGEGEPKSTVSEPLVLQVTDREGILAGLLEADEKSARQLDAIIQRELGIGDSK